MERRGASPAVGMAQERTRAAGSAMNAGIDLVAICPKCQGHGTAPTRGLFDRIRALVAPRPCAVCDGRGEVGQKFAADRLAADAIGKARTRPRYRV
jgi:hypothetical protein